MSCWPIGGWWCCLFNIKMLSFHLESNFYNTTIFIKSITTDLCVLYNISINLCKYIWQKPWQDQGLYRSNWKKGKFGNFDLKTLEYRKKEILLEIFIGTQFRWLQIYLLIVILIHEMEIGYLMTDHHPQREERRYYEPQ